MLAWWGGHRESQSRESLGVRKEGSTPAPVNLGRPLILAEPQFPQLHNSDSHSNCTRCVSVSGGHHYKIP